jgi:outer membrane immunogenic protein
MPSLALLSCAVLLATGTAGFASDMPLKARAPGGAYDWTGFYVGGTAGAAWTKADVGLDTVNNDPADLLYRTSDIPFLNALGSPNMSGSKAIFGGKIGLNHQWGPYVGGLEADFSAFRFNKSARPSGNPFVVPIYVGGTASFNPNVSTNWLATFRGRIGYSFDRTLIYVTAGVALSRISFSDTYTAHSPNGGVNDSESISASKTKLGWTLGAGIDYALTNNWIVSAEYLHIDLGSMNVSSLATTGGGFTRSATFNFSTKLTSDIVRAGIAYKF